MAFPSPRSDASPSVLHSLALSLARHPDVTAFARSLARVPAVRDRLGRIAALFAFVNALVNVPSPADGRARDGVDLLLHMAGEEHGPAVMLCALLQALGERASVVRDTRRSYVRVEVEARDFSRLPPFAGLFSQGGRYYIPLDARQSRSPLGFLARLPRRAVSGGRRI